MQMHSHIKRIPCVTKSSMCNHTVCANNWCNMNWFLRSKTNCLGFFMDALYIRLNMSTNQWSPCITEKKIPCAFQLKIEINTHTQKIKTSIFWLKYIHFVFCSLHHRKFTWYRKNMTKIKSKQKQNHNLCFEIVLLKRIKIVLF